MMNDTHDRVQPTPSLYQILRSKGEFKDAHGYYCIKYSNPFMLVAQYFSNNNPNQIDLLVLKEQQVVAAYSCPKPTKRLYKSHELSWENTEHFATSSVATFEAVFCGYKPMATITFPDQSSYEAALHRIAEGCCYNLDDPPFTTQPDQRVITMNQGIIPLGDLFNLRSWLDSFTVCGGKNLTVELLSTDDKQYILSLQDTPCSEFLDFQSDGSPSDEALAGLLSGEPTECTLSRLWK